MKICNQCNRKLEDEKSPGIILEDELQGSFSSITEGRLWFCCTLCFTTYLVGHKWISGYLKATDL